jgi:hypothetical protein
MFMPPANLAQAVPASELLVVSRVGFEFVPGVGRRAGGSGPMQVPGTWVLVEVGPIHLARWVRFGPDRSQLRR